MKLNGESLFLALNESNEAEQTYRSLSARYFAAYGHGVRLDRPTNDDERRIVYWEREMHACAESVHKVFEVLGLSADERRNAYKAARAYNALCVRLDWQRFPNADTVEALLRFIES